MPNRRAIVTYHSIDDSGSALSIAPELLRAQLESVRRRRFDLLHPPALVDAPDDGPALSLTFDDGYANFYVAAFPILLDLGFRATILIVPGLCGGRADWGGQPAGLLDRDLMSWSHIEELARARMQFGAHSMTHKPLASLSFERAKAEILESKRRIEDRLGRPVETFAYPYGAESPALRDFVAEHFAAGLSTRLGYLPESPTRASLERLDAFYLRKLYWFEGLFEPRTNAYLAVRRWMRRARQKTLGPPWERG